MLNNFTVTECTLSYDILCSEIEKVWENLTMVNRKIKMSPKFYSQLRTQIEVYKDDDKIEKFCGLKIEIDPDLKEDYEIIEEEY